MESTRSLARRAGLLYVLAGTLAPFAYLYVPGRLLVEGDALATADRVRTSEGLLRAALFGELWNATLLVFAAVTLYHLFERVEPRNSILMASIMLVSVPISYLNTLNHLAPLVLLENPAITAALDPAQVAAQVTLFLRLHGQGLVVNQILWGLWLFPLGLLILRSQLIPRWLAYPLFAASAGYVVHSLGLLLLPPSLRGITQYGQILGIGELPFFSFYLLIWGVRGPAVDRVATTLVLISFALGAAATGLLLLGRIEPTRYAALELASLIVFIALVMRWRWSESPSRSAAAPA